MQNILLPLYKAALQATSSHTENLEDSPESSGDINIRPQERNGTITEGGRKLTKIGSLGYSVV